EPSSFDVLAPLLIEKFGQPTKTDRKDIQNRMGAHYEQVSHFWRGADETAIYYSKYTGRVDSSVLSITTKEDRKLTHSTIEDRRQDL
ncbi:unnamed protein product, partial [Phaeothamnion confervicola]